MPKNINMHEPPDEAIWLAIKDERRRQWEKFGEQYLANVDPTLMARKDGCSSSRMAEEYEIPTHERARANLRAADALGVPTWAHVLIEEIAEVVDAATIGTKDELRTELIQSAAVIVQWIQRLDSEGS